MRYLVLATDYDGTLARHGEVSENAIKALEQVCSSGRKLVLVTGRHLPDLLNVFPQLDRFDRVVAENGALLYDPASRCETPLCDAPGEKFIERLKHLNVPFSQGRCVVATWEPHHTAVLDTIRELGLDLQVVFNKGAVMVLPSGLNKATGLKAALRDLGLSAHNVVGVGDAENDHPFLSVCECSFAVANALETLKDRADVVTKGENGTGVEELIHELVEDDLVRYDSRLTRHAIALGKRDVKGKDDLVSSQRNCILVAGASASGKSTAVSGILEQLARHEYQFCLIDPEGDFDNYADALTLGTAKQRPDISEVMRALEKPEQSVIVNLLAVPLSERPGYSATLLTHLQEMRTRVARPHWLVLDEAHHLLPASWSHASAAVPQSFDNTLLITVHPEQVSKAALQAVNAVLVTGRTASETLGEFAKAVGRPAPQARPETVETGEALIWFPLSQAEPVKVKTIPGTAERRRHSRQYAEGELADHQSFYFRGPENKLNLKAQNLIIFLQIADGVDDATWMHHLRGSDYSGWFRNIIKDESLANEAAEIEKDSSLPVNETRKRIKEAIESRYTRAA